MSSPTSRTLERLREEGWTAQVVERHNTYSGKKLDLFGCIDIVAVKPGLPVLGVQATSGAHHTERRHKSIAEERLLTWLSAGARFEIWSWTKGRTDSLRKDGKRGTRKVWKDRREELNGVQILNLRTERIDG